MSRLLVLDDTHIDRPPVLQAALGPALIGALPGDPEVECLRLYRTAPTVGFTGRDCAVPGISEAVAAARQHGFAAVRRGPGGRAAAYHPGSLCLDHVGRFAGEGRDIEARFARFAALLRQSLRDVGVSAEVGELPGEFCPGPFSVHDGHGRKLVGSAQRLTRDGWLLSSVLVVDDPAPLRAVLTPVYAALGVPFDPATVGAVSDSAPGTTAAQIRQALTARLADTAELTTATLDLPTLARAELTSDRFRPPTTPS